VVPTSSHLFRNLIPLLADRYHLVAPDLPGFGNTVSPPRGRFDFTFDNLARVLGAFVDALGLRRYALYVFDYGAPVGYRLAVAHPERVAAIVSQNGNAYLEGFSDAWGIYLHGSDPQRVSPDGDTLDIAYLGRPGAEEIQLDLILDYRSNVALYPAFQEYFRTQRPPLLAIWRVRRCPGLRSPIRPRCLLPLLGLGLRRLSMSPALVPTIRQLVRRVTERQGGEIAAEVLRMRTSDEIFAHLTRRTRELWPEVTLLDTREYTEEAPSSGGNTE
jgi:pimeloyl-ACP methyl ester carboxylesterase